MADIALEALSIVNTRTPTAKKQPLVPNTNLSLLHLCNNLQEAQQIHALMIKSSQITEPYYAGRMAEFYALSIPRSLDFAEQVLRSFRGPPIFIYNTIMRGYTITKDPLKSIQLYQHSILDFVEPDHFTITFALKACTQLRELGIGIQIHARVIKFGFCDSTHIRNKLIHFYTVAGNMDDARKVFEGSSDPDTVAWNSMLEGYAENKNGLLLHEFFHQMQKRDVVSWNTMIAFYVDCGQYEEAMALFRSMQESKECFPNRVTLISILSAASHLGALAHGKWVHSYVQRHRIKLDENLCSALINMYSKCGCIEGAVHVFKEKNWEKVDIWNALIAGYTANGLILKAIELFYQMESAGVVVPNQISFSCVLNACSHGGLVEEGGQYFRKMTSIYGIKPDIGHYGCMVDLFSRAGLFDKAEEMIKKMPIEPDAVMWKALVGACRIHRNFELGEKAGYRLIEAAPNDHAGYVMLSNIHALNNNWDGVYKLRKMMMERGLMKVPGCSSIELDGILHDFIAGDSFHSRKREIYDMLEEMGSRLRLAGYEPDTTQVLLDIEDEQVKESSLSHHSEKLAIAFGLISSRKGTTIRVVKNLRVCGDCHSAIKLLSRIYERDIIVRDSTRFHCFSRGLCSCGDYW